MPEALDNDLLLSKIAMHLQGPAQVPVADLLMLIVVVVREE